MKLRELCKVVGNNAQKEEQPVKKENCLVSILEKSCDFSVNKDIIQPEDTSFDKKEEEEPSLVKKRRVKYKKKKGARENEGGSIMGMIETLKKENRKNREKNSHLFEDQTLSPFDSDFFDISDTIDHPSEYFTKYQIDQELVNKYCEEIKEKDEIILDKYFSKMECLLECLTVPENLPDISNMGKTELLDLLEKTEKEISYFNKKLESNPIRTREMVEAGWFDIPPYCTPIKADIRSFDFKKLGETQQFDVILMDPPWRVTTNKPSRGVVLPYQQLSDEEIAEIPVHLFSNKGLLFIWVVNLKMSFALEILKKWGYTLVSSLIWIKTTKKRKLAKGNGYTLQHAKETCLIASKGEIPQEIIKQIRCKANSVLFPRKSTSQKPNVLHEMAEDLYPNGNYIEIFARRNNLRNFWVSIGNQL